MNVQEQGLAHIHPSHHLHPQPPPDAQGVGVHQPQHPPHLPQHMHHQTFPPMHHQLPQQLHPMQQIHHHQLGMPSHHVPNMYAEAKEIRTDGLMEEEQLTQLEDVDADLLNPFNFNLGQYVVSEDSIEPQLVDLLSMVLTMQTTMIEYLSVCVFSSGGDNAFHQAAVKRATHFRQQLATGSRKLVKLSKQLLNDRKVKRGPRRRTNITLPREHPNKRGRGRLLKCAKHRKWKKRCPVDCPDKPLNPLYFGDDDGVDDEPAANAPPHPLLPPSLPAPPIPPPPRSNIGPPPVTGAL